MSATQSWFGPVGRELALDQIGRTLRRRIHLRGAHEARRIHAAQPRRAHQSRNPFTTDMRRVFVGELGVDGRRTISTARATMNRVNLGAEANVRTRTR